MAAVPANNRVSVDCSKDETDAAVSDATMEQKNQDMNDQIQALQQRCALQLQAHAFNEELSAYTLII